jgi:cytochrome c oxidase subunit 3
LHLVLLIVVIINPIIPPTKCTRCKKVSKYKNDPAGLLYLVGGIIGLIITTIKSILKRYSAENYLGIELISIYWHFLDALWVFLFLFLIFIR